MERRTQIFLVLLLGAILFHSPAQGDEDESALFTTLSPDALVVLDLSGSMRWTPAGKTMYISSSSSCTDGSIPFYGESGTGHTKSCTIDPYETVPKYSNASCSGPFYKSSGSGNSTDCSRLAIAKRALFDILDDNDSNTITSKDEKSLGVRFGYMRFYDCSDDDTGGSYTAGCNKLIRGIGTKYSKIYCGGDTSCSPSSSGSSSISSESASGGTPITSALQEAKLYLDAHKATDPAAACRAKFAILITDGADTYACGGDGSEDQSTQYKRRRAVVAKAKALADAGYKVFVVGFGGGMPHFLRNTLNWMAYYGGTDNPLVANSGSVNAYDPSSTILCQASSTLVHNIEGDGDHSYATSDDPGENSLSGYAFLASGSDDLTLALKQAVNAIRGANYSFSMVSITSFRTQDENHIYEASFQPVSSEPFWQGHLKKYGVNADGTVGAMVWDAGTVLKSAAHDSRNMLTYQAGSLTAFRTSNLTKEILGVTTDSERDQIVGYFRGDPAYNPDNWKLGDIFHSALITVGTPSNFFEDLRDGNGAFGTFRNNHSRTSLNGQRIVLASANDGQIHAFRTNDGTEAWSLIPPNLLSILKNVAHVSHPTGLSHQYLADGPITVADAWLGTGAGTNKSSSDWATLMVLGEGRGGDTTLWSSSSSCDSGFSSFYTADYPNYCGYYSLDLTQTTNPAFKWRMQPGSGQQEYLGEPWSKMAIGRVKINGNEKWVGFVGGGYNATDCTDPGDCDSRGKGFLVVDLSDGVILWAFTRAQNTLMNFSMPASPAIVDTDFDGFIDTAYIGDLGGNMWRFKFCSASDGASCNSSYWTGGRLFAPAETAGRPIYTTATATMDEFWNLWVGWGTGDKTDPLAVGVQEKFFAVKDLDRSATYGVDNLENISSGPYNNLPTKKGWYLNLASGSEKVLADPTIFGGIVYFTSYTPDQTGDPCNQAGTAQLYGIALMNTNIAGITYAPGAGILSPPADPHSTSGGARSMNIGVGIPTSPVLSYKPSGVIPPDIYVTTSGGSGLNASTTRVNFDPPTLVNRTNILSWKDQRVQ